MKMVVFVLLLSVFAVACSSNNSGSGNGKVGQLGQPENRPLIEAAKYQQLINADSAALVQIAYNDELGNCAVERVSSSGCGYPSRSPLYTVQLRNENLHFPSMGSQLGSEGACLSSIAPDLKLALQEGFCFQNSMPLETLPDSAWVHRAFTHELGQCVVEKYSDSGCSYPSGRPLFNIRFTKSGKTLLGSDGRTATFCFESGGGDLHALYKAGACSL